MNIIILLESFSSEPYPFTVGGSLEDSYYSYSFRASDGSNVEVYVDTEEQDDVWTLEFSRTYPAQMHNPNRHGKTGTGDAWKIFATVLAATRDFIERQEPTTIEFFSGKNDESRTRLYDRMVRRFASEMGYTLYGKEPDHENFKYILTNRNFKP